MRFAPCMLACFLAGCAGDFAEAPPMESPPARPPQVESPFAPTPYTAAQIREATAEGRTYRYRVEEAGKPPVVRVMTFTHVSDHDAEIATKVQDAEGHELESEPPQKVTWEELQRHAQFRRGTVQIGKETVTVPAGTFDCAVYNVERPGEVTRFYFAKDLPGAPVLFFTEKGGTRVSTSTLLEHRSGAPNP